MKFLIIDKDESSLFLHVTFIRKMFPNSIIAKYRELPTSFDLDKDIDIIIADYDILKSIKENYFKICITSETISTLSCDDSIFDKILQKPIHYDNLKSAVVDLMFKVISNRSI